jgi:hypothetical protein
MGTRFRARTLALAVGAVAFVFGLAAAGCGSGSSVPDAKIAAALDLQRTGHGYEIGGDPFCGVDQLLNDSGEVDGASDTVRRFVIAGPNGDAGVVAHRPFAPDCTQRAKDALKRLERRSK